MSDQSEIFEKLKAKLTESGSLSDEDIAADGLTDDQRLWLSAERHARQRDKQEAITLEQYLEASKVLDSTPEGSPEHAQALKTVEAYEKQA
jgi:hypothetical protein